MLGRKLLAHRGHGDRSSRSRPSVRTAARLAVCESLEVRQLLSQFTFDVPDNEGYTAVYLRPGLEQGWVDVFKNTPTGTPVYTFKGDNDEDGTGMYIVDAGGLADFLFVDQVPAARKPTARLQDPDDHGILVQAPSVSSGDEGHLRIEAGSTDQYMTVTQSTSTSNTIEVTDITTPRTGTSRAGAGVTNLTLRTQDFPVPGTPPTPATAYYPTLAASGGGTDVVVQNLAEDIFLTVDTGAARYNRIWLGTTDTEPMQNGRIYEEANVITGAGRCQVVVRGESGAGNTTRARLDFGPRGAAGTHTGHNRLDVLVNGVATLAQLAGANHTVVVEAVKLESQFSDKPAQLYVEDASEIDDLDEIEWAYTDVLASADGTHVESFLLDKSSCFAFIRGNSTIGDLTVEGEVKFYDSSPAGVVDHVVDQFKIGPTTALPNSSGNVIIGENADVTILAPTEASSPSKIGDLRINQGALLTLAEHPTNEASRLLGVGTVFIEKTYATPMGTLDLTNNAMLVDYPSTSPVGDVRALLFHADNADNYPATGPWTDFGITSSTAAAVA